MGKGMVADTFGVGAEAPGCHDGERKSALVSMTGVKDQLIPAARASIAMMSAIAVEACTSSTAASASGFGTSVPKDGLIRLPSRSELTR